jgi:uncharacterized protein
MQQKIVLKLLPSEAADESIVKNIIARTSGKSNNDITGFHILKRSMDARSRTIWVNLTVTAFINEPFTHRQIHTFNFKDVSKAKKTTVIIGAGPAGMFAALALIEAGVKPILLERGKDVRARRRDLAVLNKEGIVNPESNYCFGEGGAGTYSDGKLYTRSSKRGDIDRILNLFVHFGANANILYEAHPHIGTNKLPQIITAMREQVLQCGGQFLFEQKVTDFTIENNRIKAVKTASGDSFEAADFILATGHSARDIFELLHRHKILIEAKPFALGVRIEHPQQLIDSMQYHCTNRSDLLPAASYSLVQQVEQKGVFSFCMCPGGIIAPAATAPGELVVNGWSPSKRNNPFANSGMVVQVEAEDAISTLKKAGISTTHAATNPLLMMQLQQLVEQDAFTAGGGNMVAPAQRMADFCEGKVSATLPVCSYNPGLNAVDLSKVLPGFIHRSLQLAFNEFGKKMRGYFTNEAVVVATESRTSSPVRIPRLPHTLAHPQLHNLYPCGEGAGYAGGIVSAAMDGERIAAVISEDGD